MRYPAVLRPYGPEALTDNSGAGEWFRLELCSLYFLHFASFEGFDRLVRVTKWFDAALPKALDLSRVPALTVGGCLGWGLH